MRKEGDLMKGLMITLSKREAARNGASPLSSASAGGEETIGADSPDETEENESLTHVSRDLLEAVDSNDEGAVAMSLRAAFEILQEGG